MHYIYVFILGKGVFFHVKVWCENDHTVSTRRLVASGLKLDDEKKPKHSGRALFFRSNSVDEEERRAAFFGLTPPHHACHSHSTGQLLYCTPCVCANILAAWKHTRHFDTQGRKKKGVFPKNNKTFSWKPVVAVARHPVFYQACWWQMLLNTWRVLC